MRDLVTNKAVNSFYKADGTKKDIYNVYFREDMYNYCISNLDEKQSIDIVNALNNPEITTDRIKIKLAFIHAEIRIDSVIHSL